MHAFLSVRLACEQGLLFGQRSEPRENARASGEAARGRERERESSPFASPSRLASLAQIGELARRLVSAQ